MIGNVVAVTALAAFMVFSLGAQPVEQKLKKLTELGLAEAPGEVPVFYVKSAEERAIRLQKSLQAGHAWFQKQLHVQVPITLAVLDSATWGKVTHYPYGMPHEFDSESGPGLVVFAATPVPKPPSPPLPGIDRDHAYGGVLNSEHILFHEVGHILAGRLKIMRRPNHLVDELVATMFAASYIAFERPDMNVFLQGRRAAQPPRYTSLADLDYLGHHVGQKNYTWLHQELWPLAAVLVKGHSFPTLVEKLQKLFPPSANDRALMPEEIVERLERIQPDFSKGSLNKPSTITRIKPAACPESARGMDNSDEENGQPVVVRNNTNEPLDIPLAEDPGQIWRVAAHSWRTANDIRVGSAFKLPDGTCLVAREEPTLAVIGRQ